MLTALTEIICRNLLATNIFLSLPSPQRATTPSRGGVPKNKMDPATLAQIAATHPLVKTVESGEEPTGPAAEAIRRQVESLLAIDMEDPELHEAMDVVADLWKSKGMGNTAENRRNLRSDLERQAVERCEDFVRQMAPMRDMLRQAEANADLLDRQAQASVEDLE